MVICEFDKCTGCMACYNICPVEAIEVIEDAEGFLRPEIQECKCIKCKKCINVCPSIVNVEHEKFNQKIYACWNKDNDIRKNSTSGGLFTLMANSIIEQKGIVFGAIFDNVFNVIHAAIDDKNNLVEFRGSKYVQSNLKDTFKECKMFLDKERPVLFSGTPCQIAGLYNFLGKRYDNLYTCDLVCHGVPSPKVFKSYIKYIENIYKSQIKNINFRDKKNGWKVYSMKIIFQNGKKYTRSTFRDPYIRGFLRDYFIRPSCSICEYANINRIGDITIGDFWGYQSTRKSDIDDDKGISLSIINSKNGDKLFELCKNDIVFFNRDLKEAMHNRCLSKPFPPSPQRKEFWEDFNTKPFDYIIRQYMYPEKKEMVEKIKIISGRILGKMGIILSRETKYKLKRLLLMK